MFKLLFAGLILVGTFNAHSQVHSKDITIKLYTSAHIKKFIAPFPAKGSEAEAVDFQTLYKYQETRTQEECAQAASTENASLENMFANPGGPLSKSEARVLSFTLAKVFAEVGLNINTAKKTFKRLRPYKTDAGIVPCIDLEGSYAYPSGHTTLSRVLARILSQMYPNRAEALMKRADEIAHHRILGGVHHPSDIEAGQKFGDIMASGISLR